LSLPILLAVAMLYTPAAAATVLFVGLFDPRELKRAMPLSNSLFNRAEVALSTAFASWVFHELASIYTSDWYRYLMAGVVAAIAFYVVNVVMIALVVTLESTLPFKRVLSELRVGALPDFLLNCLGLSVVGVAMALFFVKVGFWSVIAFGAPLVFARQMFFRSKALEEASEELRDRERVLKALSNRMAEERIDEREMIAAYLHDDLAQTLFQLTLRLEMAKKRLRQDDIDGVRKDLEDIGEIKEKTSDMVRSLVRDLHRSPIGRAGLASAIKGFVDEAGRGSDVLFEVDVVEVSLPPPIQLLIYQIGREAVMNSLKHAEPAHLWVSMHETEGGVEFQVRDDGKGFDTSGPQPEGHFGRVMMRERALVAGGSFTTQSEPGKGTTVTASFPRLWLEEGAQLQPRPATDPPPGLPVQPQPRRMTAPARRPSSAPPAPATPSASPAPAHSSSEPEPAESAPNPPEAAPQAPPAPPPPGPDEDQEHPHPISA
ncbi:MAG TPA: sensor histidine kinase, partial [Actinomycetota bacterium]